MDPSVNLFSIKEIYGRKNCEAIVAPPALGFAASAPLAPSEAPLRAPLVTMGRLNRNSFNLKNPMGEKIAKQSPRPNILGFAASASSAPSEAPWRAPRLNNGFR
jgi:hypothetical protein